MPDDSDDLPERARRALAGSTVATAFGRVRAIIGPEKFPDGEDLAQQGLDALNDGKVPSPAQRAALEMVIKALRPSILSNRSVFDVLPNYQRYEPGTVEQWEAFRKASKPYLYSIGRIDQVTGGLRDAEATGFVVAPGVLVTNRHVLEVISANSMVLEKGQAIVCFGQEFGVVPDLPPVSITGVIAVHPELDMALLRIEGDARVALPIDASPVQRGARVCAVGYPQDDARSPVFRDVVYQGKFGVKRGAPGEIRKVSPNALYHDCSTLGGNSGSPLLDLNTCKVVGLHRDGPLFMYRNEAVDGSSLDAFVRQNVP